MKSRTMRNAILCLVSAALAASCASPQHDRNVQTVQLVKSSASWDGKPLPPYKKGTPEITILRITVPPKQALPMHKHPTINAGVLLKGELTVTKENGEILHLKPYDSIVEVMETWHYGRNDGNVPAEIIVFYAGEKDKPITIKKHAH